MRPKGAYYVLTGERNSGKTVICNDLVAEARARDMDVAGILTGLLVGPELQAPRGVINIRSGATHLFKQPVYPSSDSFGLGRTSDQDVFTWAGDVLLSATPCDLLIIDELGPLELEKGQGFIVALGVLRKGDFGAALVVCRPDMVGPLEESLGTPPVAVFEAEPDNSVQLPDLMLAKMFG